MRLSKYKQKRSFTDSPEPQGGYPSEAKLRFVVQKHHASQMHYDFRLEMQGVLKSWAVPKGPSMDPSVKRLAVMVEDHPFDYRSFEGEIPQGNYGAGTVMIWDEGYYEPDLTDAPPDVATHPAKENAETSQASESPAADKEKIDKFFTRQIRQGKIRFVLKGKKLKGLFALVKTSNRGENTWLLMKLQDRYATSADILLRDRSVVSRRTMEGIRRRAMEPARSSSDRILNISGSPTPRKRKKSSVRPPVSGKTTHSASAVRHGSRGLMPEELLPMLAMPVDKPFDEEGWLYEVKWDGYRAVSYLSSGDVRILSRNGKSFDKKFYPIHAALSEWKINAVVDGEIVVVNNRGLSDFSALQNWRSEADGHLLYYVFDLLWWNGKDLRSLPLETRRAQLGKLVPSGDLIRLSEAFDTSGTEIYKKAGELGLEGIIAKRAGSLYRSGKRTTDWLKIKVNHRQEVVIGGYTKNEDSPKLFSALLVGVFKAGQLAYVGKVGTGFNAEIQRSMMKQFSSRIIARSPFSITPDVNSPSRFRPAPPNAEVIWLRPDLVGEVTFTEITNDGVMRHPSFQGMRDDKPASTVVWERERSASDIVRAVQNNSRIIRAGARAKSRSGQKAVSPQPKGGTGASKGVQQKAMDLVRPVDTQERKTLLNPNDETQVRTLRRHEIKFTSLSKIYWPDVKVTKRDMINYYYQIAPFLLPYLKGRPQSLNRYPNGIKGKSFYQKDVTGKVPDWVKTHLYHTSDSPEDKHFLVPESEADILLMANMGCIELNPWSSTAAKPDHPDWCIIDLDPDKNTFEQVITAARVTREILDEIGADSFCKTSGSTGIHIYIPLKAKYTYEASKEFARALVSCVHQQLPFTSLERTIAARKGRMYLDFLQNRSQATVASAYSLRPKPGATVSMPLHWDEVKRGLKLSDFNIFNAMERVRSEGDLFKGVLGKGVNLDRATRKLSQMMAERTPAKSKKH